MMSLFVRSLFIMLYIIARMLLLETLKMAQLPLAPLQTTLLIAFLTRLSLRLTGLIVSLAVQPQLAQHKKKCPVT